MSSVDVTDHKENDDGAHSPVILLPDDVLSPSSTREDREDEVYHSLLAGRNVFLTSPGGTGKSFMLRSIALRLEAASICAFKTASTGVAATNIEGSTLHSFAGIGLGGGTPHDHLVVLQGRGRKALKRWLAVRVLIIDEISMIGAKLFGLLNGLAKLIRGSTLPFGGIQLLISGDVLQLPPVNDEYFFQDQGFAECMFKVIRLTKPWRFQKDVDYFHILNRIRLGQPTTEDLQALEERKQAYFREILGRKFRDDEIKPTVLYAKNRDVDAINRAELEKLPGEAWRYLCHDQLLRKGPKGSAKKGPAPIHGDMKGYQDLMEKSRIPSELILKVGAQVMLTKNLDVDNGLVNGSRGVVLELFDTHAIVKFKGDNEVTISAGAFTIENDTEIFTRTQVNLVLAWSVSIHKSQGQTLDFVVTSAGADIFCGNMAYVVLSRVRNIKSLFLIDFDPSKIYAEPEALEFEGRLTRMSSV